SMAATKKATSKKKAAPKKSAPPKAASKKATAKATKPGQPSAAAAYAWESKLTMGVHLDDPRYTVAEDDSVATFRFAGAPYLRMRLDGEDLEVDFRAPRELEELEGALRYYQRLKEPAGWLRIRRPATQDPRPWLEADFGAMLGTTARELRLA